MTRARLHSESVAKPAVPGAWQPSLGLITTELSLLGGTWLQEATKASDNGDK